MAWRIIIAILCRLLLNTARRFAYPFAPVLSRGLGVPLTAITSLIAVNQATAIMGIGFGPLADRFGYRRMMLIGMGMLSLGMLTAGLFPFYYSVMARLVSGGFGKVYFRSGHSSLCEPTGSISKAGDGYRTIGNKLGRQHIDRHPLCGHPHEPT